jgi:hypothetical protein
MSPNEPAECVITAPWQYEFCARGIATSFLIVRIVDWPLEDVELERRDVEGVNWMTLVVDVPIRHLRANGFEGVAGAATESAEVRDVSSSTATAPRLVLAPRGGDFNFWVSGEEQSIVIESPTQRDNTDFSIGSTADATHSRSVTSWEHLSLDIAPDATPTRYLAINSPRDARLDQLQALGARASLISILDVSDALFADYVSWLPTAGFSGIVSRCALSGDVLSCEEQTISSADGGAP